MCSTLLKSALEKKNQADTPPRQRHAAYGNDSASLSPSLRLQWPKQTKAKQRMGRPILSPWTASLNLERRQIIVTPLPSIPRCKRLREPCGARSLARNVACRPAVRVWVRAWCWCTHINIKLFAPASSMQEAIG